MNMTIVEEIKQRIRKEIDAGVFKDDSKLPSIRGFSSKYNASAASVKRAIDELQRDGVVVTVHGKGVFIGGSPVNPRRIGSKIIGAILITDRDRMAIERIKSDYLEDGWLFAIYDADTDLQSPEKEKLFLNRAEEQGFAGIAIIPTPRSPLNSDLYRRLRLLGIKLVMLAQYKSDMSEDCCCVFDHVAAVDLAIMNAVDSGFENVAYLGHPKDYFTYADITSEAYSAKISENGLPDLKLCDDIFSLSALPALKKWCANLPESTMVLCENSGCAAKIAEYIPPKCLNEKNIGITNLFGENNFNEEGISKICFDSGDVLRKAVEFITNTNTSSMDHFLQLSPPRLLPPACP